MGLLRRKRLDPTVILRRKKKAKDQGETTTSNRLSCHKERCWSEGDDYVQPTPLVTAKKKDRDRSLPPRILPVVCDDNAVYLQDFSWFIRFELLLIHTLRCIHWGFEVVEFRRACVLFARACFNWNQRALISINARCPNRRHVCWGSRTGPFCKLLFQHPCAPLKTLQ